jgi:hypothetical protein
VSVESGRDDKTGKSQSVGDSLDGLTSRSESRRSNVGAAVVVDNNTDDNVDDGNDSLAKDQSLLVVLGLTHLGSNGEEDGSSAVGKDEGGDGRHGLGEGGRVEELVVGLPDTILRGKIGALLNTNSDSDDED